MPVLVFRCEESLAVVWAPPNRQCGLVSKRRTMCFASAPPVPLWGTTGVHIRQPRWKHRPQAHPLSFILSLLLTHGVCEVSCLPLPSFLTSSLTTCIFNCTYLATENWRSEPLTSRLLRNPPLSFTNMRFSVIIAIALVNCESLLNQFDATMSEHSSSPALLLF